MLLAGLVKIKEIIMKKSYLTLLYFIFFVPFSVYYKIFKRPIFIETTSTSAENENIDTKVVLMLNESKKYRPSILVKLLEEVTLNRVKRYVESKYTLD